MKTNDGGPAFPVQQVANGTTTKGMTLRDWFAGQALAGYIVEQCPASDVAAENAYKFADAMLAARELKQES